MEPSNHVSPLTQARLLATTTSAASRVPAQADMMNNASLPRAAQEFFLSAYEKNEYLGKLNI